ncbi:hypothetical protein [Salinibaculum rarum]|uniref:hypothetical protein n=1 Tax=Salinibaculum rarum TaxID=3058903 RepID=UPI00265DF71A|nr:hypothetical protein [Salinibaculum sp. KK48]
MRYKVVPAPADRALLTDVHEALPLVPGSVEDCCTRIRDRTTVPSRDEAREWLTFATALGLVAETERGYHRVRNPPEPDRLVENFRENVFGVEEVLGALDDAETPLDDSAAFESVRNLVPRWERNRYADWESEWTDKVRLRLAWSEAFGLVTRGDNGYERA